MWFCSCQNCFPHHSESSTLLAEVPQTMRSSNKPIEVDYRVETVKSKYFLVSKLRQEGEVCVKRNILQRTAVTTPFIFL